MKRNGPLSMIVLGIALCIISISHKGGCDLPISILNPIPVKEKGLRILIVEEAQERRNLPPSQLAIFTAEELRTYAKEHCARVNGAAEFRVFDKDTNLDAESDVWNTMMKVERKSLPWLCVTNGSRGYSGPLPTTLDETMTIIKKYGD